METMCSNYCSVCVIGNISPCLLKLHNNRQLDLVTDNAWAVWLREKSVQVLKKKNTMKRFVGLVSLRTGGRIPEDCMSAHNNTK